MNSRFSAPVHRGLLTGLLLALVLGLSPCQKRTRAAAPPAPHPYFPIEPGAAWTLQFTHWDYPSRFEAMPLVFDREEFFRIVSAGPGPGGFTIRTEPGFASLLFLAGLGLEPAELVQDAEGFWLKLPVRKKGDRGLLLLPASPSAGQNWSAVAPNGIEFQCRVLSQGETYSAGTAMEVPDALGLEMVFTFAGQSERRVLWLGRGLGPISLEAFTGDRRLDQWRRTDLDPFIRRH